MLLLLDIDGVLNPFAATEPPDGFVDHDLGYEEPIRLSLSHRDWLLELARRYEMVWASGWGDEANTVLAPLLGLPPWPVVPFPPVPFPPEAKVPSIDRYVGDAAVAWVDDAHTEVGRTWAAERPYPTLLVPCQPDVGLTRADIDQLLRWAP